MPASPSNKLTAADMLPDSEVRFATGFVSDPLADEVVATQQVEFGQFQLARAEDGFWRGMDLFGADALKSPLPDNNVALEVNVTAGLFVRFRQLWNLQRVAVGDLVTHTSLAPKESVRLLVSRTERRTLERSKENSSQIDSSSELTQSDKESLNVAQTAAASKQWSVSANVGFSIPSAGLSGGGSADQSGSNQSSVATTSDSVHETTVKSSQALRTQTKVSVKTVEESTETNSSSRVLVNPSDSKMLHLWGYEVVKRFQVVTAPFVVCPVLRIGVEPPRMDAVFIATQAAYLTGALIDDTLRAMIPSAQRAARRQLQAQSRQDLGESEWQFEMVERLLCEDDLSSALGPGVSDLLSIQGGGAIGSVPFVGTYAVSFASIHDISLSVLAGGTTKGGENSGLETVGVKAGEVSLEFKEWVKAGQGTLFLAWVALYRLRLNVENWATSETRRTLIRKFLSMCRQVNWSAEPAVSLVQVTLENKESASLYGANSATNMYGGILARRIQMAIFLTDIGVAGSSAEATDPFELQAFTDEQLAFDALSTHLKLFRSAYGASWLRWIERLGGNAVFVHIANAVLSKVTGSAPSPVVLSQPTVPYQQLYRAEDIYVVDSEIYVPIRGDSDLDSPFTHAPKLGPTLKSLRRSAQQFADRSGSPARVGRSGGTRLGTVMDRTVVPSHEDTRIGLGPAVDIDLGDPGAMQRSSTVDVVANGVYVSGRFE